MAQTWRGRRTGLVIDDTQVSKDLDGLDNIDSFWDSARLGRVGGGRGEGRGARRVKSPHAVSCLGAALCWARLGSARLLAVQDFEGRKECRDVERRRRIRAECLDKTSNSYHTIRRICC